MGCARSATLCMLHAWECRRERVTDARAGRQSEVRSKQTTEARAAAYTEFEVNVPFYVILPPLAGLSSDRQGVVSEFSRFEIMCPSVRPIERAMREPRTDTQSTVFHDRRQVADCL